MAKNTRDNNFISVLQEADLSAKEAGENPERCRHCDGELFSLMPLGVPGRRKDAMNLSQDTACKLTHAHGKVAIKLD